MRPKRIVERRLRDFPPGTPQDTPCRLWQGRTDRGGYGLRGDSTRIHRWVWEQANGPIPEGMKVMHRCDNPPCFRLDHLVLGTQADNLEDMTAKGRRVFSNPPRERGRWRPRITVGALALMSVAGATGCTPDEVQAWLAWHEVDPAAAEAHAAELDQPDPEPVSTGGWTVNWDSVAQCESGGSWGHGPVSNSHGTFSGGLMIGHRWWNAHGGGQFASAPYLASKAQQIIVAERIVDANGGGYAGADQGWQCVR